MYISEIPPVDQNWIFLLWGWIKAAVPGGNNSPGCTRLKMYTINSIYLHDYIFYQMTVRLSTENDSFLIKVLEKTLKNPYFERRFRENNEINIIFGRESSFFRQLESLGASEGENSHFVNREYAVKQGDEDWCEGNRDE